ncbi:GDSL esterase/lipase-like [Forsythia ovata]|uniref:GDSL esterase/lipase-like n=1 Tax=Forsythia ovata TaxID=205694 RepID=A0ABD1PXC5_9LAMI
MSNKQGQLETLDEGEPPFILVDKSKKRLAKQKGKVQEKLLRQSNGNARASSSTGIDRATATKERLKDILAKLCPISISNALHILPKFPYFDTLNFDKIYQVGDSISDTGNLIRESPIGSLTPFARLPYGETFFKNATGRCSNGLLMIDFIALSSGLPLLKPYKEAEANFSHGVNFAVAGSTALPVETLAAMNVLSPVTTSSLDVQLDWMHSHFNSTFQSQTGLVIHSSGSK